MKVALGVSGGIAAYKAAELVRLFQERDLEVQVGMSGAGRLAAAETISSAVFEALGLREDLKHETILITAGPTEEPLDAVRFISNRSSGKMGYALAQASRRRGARVILVSGPTQLE